MQNKADQRRDNGDNRNETVLDFPFCKDAEGEHSEDRSVGVACQLVDSINGTGIIDCIDNYDNESHSYGHADMDNLPCTGNLLFALA